jgi:hypothetical protein
MSKKQLGKTYDQIWDILNQIQFMDRNFRLLSKGSGFLLQVEYWEVDVDSPATMKNPAIPVLQRGRKWYVSPFSTETEIVETAFKAIKISMMHVVKEHFTYKGRRVYSPHFDINGRIQLCDDKVFDGRITDKAVRKMIGEPSNSGSDEYYIHYKGGKYILKAIAQTHHHNGDEDVVYYSLARNMYNTRPLKRDSRNEDSWTDVVVWPDGVYRTRFVKEDLLSEEDKKTLRDIEKRRQENCTQELADEARKLKLEY